MDLISFVVLAIFGWRHRYRRVCASHAVADRGENTETTRRKFVNSFGCDELVKYIWEVQSFYDHTGGNRDVQYYPEPIVQNKYRRDVPDDQDDCVDYGSLLDRSYGFDSFADPYDTFSIHGVHLGSTSPSHETGQVPGGCADQTDISVSSKAAHGFGSHHYLCNSDSALISDIDYHVLRESTPCSGLENMVTGEVHPQRGIRNSDADPVPLVVLTPGTYQPDSSEVLALSNLNSVSNRDFQETSFQIVPGTIPVPYDVYDFRTPPNTLRSEFLAHEHIPSLPPTKSVQVVPKLRVPCQKGGCPKTFSRLADMKRHFNKHDSRSEIYFCDEEDCKFSKIKRKGFYRRDKLTSHQRKMHGTTNNVRANKPKESTPREDLLQFS
ncbi:hypothetical protein MMC32_000488 [Xylographa parallela]|nr:hypothetical protein [Xylographa parallela]